MTNAVDRLMAVVTPPSPTGIEVDWAETYRALGSVLPADYVQLIDRYGGGQFDEYLWLLEPSSRSLYNLIEIAEERAEALEYLWSMGESKPPQLETPGTRAIAWASTDNGEYIYWLAEPGRGPDEWTVLVNEARGEQWAHFEMGCADFLTGTLTGAVSCELLWSRYPSEPHTFESSGSYPRD